jgi:hypothetical protein
MDRSGNSTELLFTSSIGSQFFRDVERHTQPTQGGERVTQGLDGMRRRARARKKELFTTLLHLTVDLLRESYYALKRNAAPGVDGISWQEYEHDLMETRGRVPRLSRTLCHSNVWHNV